MTERPSASAPDGWAWADAWILAAIGPATRSDDLRDLVAQADFLDDAVPTAEELGRALGRLLASGLVVEVDGRWVPTDAGRAVSQWPARGLPSIGAALERLADVPLVEGALDRAGDVQDAIRRYVAS